MGKYISVSSTFLIQMFEYHFNKFSLYFLRIEFKIAIVIIKCTYHKHSCLGMLT